MDEMMAKESGVVDVILDGLMDGRMVNVFGVVDVFLDG